MSELWQIKYYHDLNGSQPVQDFLQDPSLTSGELKQLRVRLYLLTTKGMSLLIERSDIIDKIETEDNIYELRLDNTPNNPRFLFCVLSGKRIFILHAFKKKGRKTPKSEISIAAKRRDLLLLREQNQEESKDE
ncbi:MAG TPA: type II toxin-antitoxin system RelE/ParE family toxin [Nostocaceae cyanobacterium]|nr:type II toxin-antitoxin system RelE/ParE family toxin [Nostocaceae cyanobacterium]